MRALVTIVASALAAAGGHALVAAIPASEPRAAAQAGADVAELRRTIDGLRAEDRRLTDEIERRASALADPSAARTGQGIGDGEMTAALERWRAAHPAEERAVAEQARKVRIRPTSIDADSDIATVPMGDILRRMGSGTLTNIARQQLFQDLREAGRIDEYVSEIERLAAADPENVELQVALGNAYLQKLFGVGNTPEAGPLAISADQAFDRALELDDHNWEARFTKAVSLANWPAFLGRGPEAIDHFETLIEQQGEIPPRPEFAMTYLFLGNVYQANNDAASALATWREGLALFPENENLLNAVQLATEEKK